MRDTSIHFVPLDQADARAVEHLLDVAFGPDRHLRTAYRLRQGVAPIAALSIAALDADRALIGSLQSWPVQLAADDRSFTPLTLVGPVAVDPRRQRGGLGREMMTRMLATADAHGADPQVLIGDPEYYGRFFGFIADPTAQWTLPGPFEPRRLLARANGTALPAHGRLEPRR